MARVLIRGSGDVGSAVAHLLQGHGHEVVIQDVATPAAPRRGMAFADAFFDGVCELEGVRACRADLRELGETVATIDGEALLARLGGILRGLVHDGVPVAAGAKVVEVDPRGDLTKVYGIGPRPRRIAEGVLEAIQIGAAESRRHLAGTQAHAASPSCFSYITQPSVGVIPARS